MLKKIISGGQTGADQGALHGARVAGLETGGTAPKGWMTEWGPAESLLLHYNLCQSQYSPYPVRTKQNILDSDGTLIFGDPTSRGSWLTAHLCRQNKRAACVVLWKASGIEQDTYSSVAKWIRVYNIKTLNVAGNRESKNPGIHVAVKHFIVDLVAELKKEQ